MMFRVIVAGSREFTDYLLLKEVLDLFLKDKDPAEVAIVSGTARGADTLGEMYAKQHNLPCERYAPQWSKYGRSAGPQRNALMAENAEALVAFWDGESKGTKSMIDIATRKGLEVKVVMY